MSLCEKFRCGILGLKPRFGELKPRRDLLKPRRGLLKPKLGFKADFEIKKNYVKKYRYFLEADRRISRAVKKDEIGAKKEK